jgi:DNA-directed RNA polymerase subunit P
MNILHTLNFMQSDSDFGGILYECVRCSIVVPLEELNKLPEIKCICGYRILKKIRPSVVKQIKSY